VHQRCRVPDAAGLQPVDRHLHDELQQHDDTLQRRLLRSVERDMRPRERGRSVW
jgi:hypothetical protein